MYLYDWSALHYSHITTLGTL